MSSQKDKAEEAQQQREQARKDTRDADAKAKKEPKKHEVGDRIWIPATITGIGQGDICMVAVENEMPGSGIVTVSLHVSQFEADDSSHPPQIGGDGGDKGKP